MFRILPLLTHIPEFHAFPVSPSVPSSLRFTLHGGTQSLIHVQGHNAFGSDIEPDRLGGHPNWAPAQEKTLITQQMKSIGLSISVIGINEGRKCPKAAGGGGGGGGMNHSPVEGAEDGGINGSMLFPSLFP